MRAETYANRIRRRCCPIASQKTDRQTDMKPTLYTVGVTSDNKVVQISTTIGPYTCKTLSIGA